MSRLEQASIPILTPLLLDQPFLFRTIDQRIVAFDNDAWNTRHQRGPHHNWRDQLSNAPETIEIILRQQQDCYEIRI